jgi:hypothetical protein
LKPKFGPNRVNNFQPKTTTEEITTTTKLTTTSRPRLGGGFKPRPPKSQTVRDLLSSIPKDNVDSLLPKGYNNKGPSRPFNKRPLDTIDSIKQDDVKSFLPPGFKLDETTTSTTTDTSLIRDILSSIEQDDLKALLPKDFGPLPDFSKNKSRPKPPRLFQSKTTQESTTNRLGLTKISATTETTKPSLLNSLKFDDVSAFLPPGFNPSAIEKPEVTTSSTPTTEKSNGFKLDISSLFDDIKTDDVAALLPPDFNKPASTRAPTTAAETESTTAKIFLKFPTRPGGTGKRVESASKSGGIQGPQPFVPKIKSFADRYEIRLCS